MNGVPLDPPVRLLDLEIDGRLVRVPEGASILDALRAERTETPTLCHAPNLTPQNACRVCVVELEGARTLVPSCARAAEEGMRIRTDSERVRRARRLVLELLGSAADLSITRGVEDWIRTYGADPGRFGPPASPAAPGERDGAVPGHHAAPDVTSAATVAEPVRIDNDLYVRDYARCILCYKCVEACGDDAQHTFAIAVAGRGFDARISTEFAVPLPDSACVYCGNCVGVCPTGALVPTTEHAMREAGTWDESRQEVTETICPYCGVGCTLEVHVQDDAIVKVTSPADSSVTAGHLCIKGRFGHAYVGTGVRARGRTDG